MLRFFRESLKEFDHVVWPTHRETTRYFAIVLSVIAVFTVFLAIVGIAFRTGLFGARAIVNPTTAVSAPSTLPDVPDFDLSSIIASGAVIESSGSLSTGAIVPVVASTGATK